MSRPKTRVIGVPVQESDDMEDVSANDFKDGLRFKQTIMSGQTGVVLEQLAASTGLCPGLIAHHVIAKFLAEISATYERTGKYPYLNIALAVRGEAFSQYKKDAEERED